MNLKRKLSRAQFSFEAYGLKSPRADRFLSEFLA